MTNITNINNYTKTIKIKNKENFINEIKNFSKNIINLKLNEREIIFELFELFEQNYNQKVTFTAEEQTELNKHLKTITQFLVKNHEDSRTFPKILTSHSSILAWFTAQYGAANLLEYLITQNIDYSIKMGLNGTNIVIQAIRGNTTCLELVLKNANYKAINFKDNKGNNAILQLAAKASCEEHYKMLLLLHKAGCNPSALNSANYNFWEICAANYENNQEFLSFLYSTTIKELDPIYISYGSLNNFSSDSIEKVATEETIQAAKLITHSHLLGTIIDALSGNNPYYILTTITDYLSQYEKELSENNTTTIIKEIITYLSHFHNIGGIYDISSNESVYRNFTPEHARYAYSYTFNDRSRKKLKNRNIIAIFDGGSTGTTINNELKPKTNGVFVEAQVPNEPKNIHSFGTTIIANNNQEKVFQQKIQEAINNSQRIEENIHSIFQKNIHCAIQGKGSCTYSSLELLMLFVWAKKELGLKGKNWENTKNFIDEIEKHIPSCGYHKFKKHLVSKMTDELIEYMKLINFNSLQETFPHRLDLFISELQAIIGKLLLQKETELLQKIFNAVIENGLFFLLTDVSNDNPISLEKITAYDNGTLLIHCLQKHLTILSSIIPESEKNDYKKDIIEFAAPCLFNSIDSKQTTLAEQVISLLATTGLLLDCMRWTQTKNEVKSILGLAFTNKNIELIKFILEKIDENEFEQFLLISDGSYQNNIQLLGEDPDFVLKNELLKNLGKNKCTILLDADIKNGNFLSPLKERLQYIITWSNSKKRKLSIIYDENQENRHPNNNQLSPTRNRNQNNNQPPLKKVKIRV